MTPGGLDTRRERVDWLREADERKPEMEGTLLHRGRSLLRRWAKAELRRGVEGAEQTVPPHRRDDFRA